MTEWDGRSWCWWPGVPVRQHNKVTMSVHSQLGTRSDMTLNVAMMQINNKQIDHFERVTIVHIIPSHML